MSDGDTVGMTPDDEFLAAAEAEVRELLLAELHADSSHEAKATRLLYERVLETTLTIETLSRHATNSWEHDGQALLRCAYDATIQLLYLVKSKETLSERAELFLGFEIIEWHRARRLLDRSPEALQRFVRNSSRRADVEPSYERLLLEIGTRYLLNKGREQFRNRGQRYLLSTDAKYREHWYPGTLADLAKECGYPGEYEWFQFETSASVHSSTLFLLRPPSNRRRQTSLFMCSSFALRCAGAIARTFSVALDPLALRLTADAAASIYARPTSS